MVVSGFIEPLVKELPMEYAIEMKPAHPASNGRFGWIAAMAERVVISRSRKADVVETREFNFTPDLVRGLGEDGLSPSGPGLPYSSLGKFPRDPNAHHYRRTLASH